MIHRSHVALSAHFVKFLSHRVAASVARQPEPAVLLYSLHTFRGIGSPHGYDTETEQNRTQ